MEEEVNKKIQGKFNINLQFFFFLKKKTLKRNQTEIPSRPSGQRTEYDPQQHYQGGYPNYYVF